MQRGWGDVTRRPVDSRTGWCYLCPYSCQEPTYVPCHWHCKCGCVPGRGGVVQRGWGDITRRPVDSRTCWCYLCLCSCQEPTYVPCHWHCKCWFVPGGWRDKLLWDQWTVDRAWWCFLCLCPFKESAHVLSHWHSEYGFMMSHAYSLAKFCKHLIKSTLQQLIIHVFTVYTYQSYEIQRVISYASTAVQKGYNLCLFVIS